MKKIVLMIAAFCMALSAGAAEKTATIKNGKTPKGTAMTLKVVEDLRLGPDDGEEYIWPSAAALVDADDTGRMYVLDVDGRRIMQYAPDGAFIRQIGGPGEGPGEFQIVAGWQILEDGRGVAFSPMGPASSFTYFNADMSYQDKVTIKSSLMGLQQAQLSPDGRYAMLMGFNAQPPKMAIHWLLVDTETEKEIDLMSYEIGMPNQETFTSADKFTDFMAQNFQQGAKGLVAFSTFSPQGGIYSATARSYEITKYNRNLEPDVIITRDYKPIPQSEEEIKASIEPVTEALKAALPPAAHQLISKSGLEKAIAKAGFPPVKFPISGLNVLEDGSILVIHEVDLLEKTVVLDIFDPNGIYIGNYTHEIDGLLDLQFSVKFKNGFMYRIQPNEYDENQLVRSKYSLVPLDKI